MRAAFVSVNVIGKRQQRAVIVIRILQRDFNRNAFILTFHINRFLQQVFFLLRQEINIRFQAAFIMKHQLFMSRRTLISKRQLKPLIQKGQLTNPRCQDFIIKRCGFRENIRIRLKMNLGAMLMLRRRAKFFHRRVNLAAHKVDVISLAAANNRHIQIR